MSLQVTSGQSWGWEASNLHLDKEGQERAWGARLRHGDICCVPLCLLCHKPQLLPHCPSPVPISTWAPSPSQVPTRPHLGFTWALLSSEPLQTLRALPTQQLQNAKLSEMQVLLPRCHAVRGILAQRRRLEGFPSSQSPFLGEYGHDGLGNI